MTRAIHITTRKQNLTKTAIVTALGIGVFIASLSAGASTLKPSALELYAGPVHITVGSRSGGSRSGGSSSGFHKGVFQARLGTGSEFRLTLVLAGDRRINIY